jgi:hypothetical protein
MKTRLLIYTAVRNIQTRKVLYINICRATIEILTAELDIKSRQIERVTDLRSLVFTYKHCVTYEKASKLTIYYYT